MSKVVIETPAAPAAIGTYSQAVRHGNTLYLSGQIPLVPSSMEIVSGDIRDQVTRVFENLKAVAEAGGATLQQALKLTIYVVDLAHFPIVNEVMASYFTPPYPARATVQVAALPRGALVEIDAIVGL
ncbi:MAG: RidA family protein [Gammaproteobacteria bacterium]|nr:RidA family protein [Gammaproteobacteria bacterium]